MVCQVIHPDAHGFVKDHSLICGAADAVLQNRGIGQIFMKGFKFPDHQPYYRIKPLKDFRYFGKQQVEAVFLPDVGAFMGENGCKALLPDSLFIQEDQVEEREW